MTIPYSLSTTVAVLGDGRYALGAEIGRGGVALTRRAYDRKLDRHVAIKSLHPGTGAADRARLLREARTLARFDHPGIVRVYEAFEEGAAVHLVMELLEGRSLAAELAARRRPLKVDEAAAVATGSARALDVVHAAGMLHRDVSPSNVVLVGGRPVLIDFGLARDGIGGATVEIVTRMVTPGFAPPEQYDGDTHRIGPPSDVYGLAATLYHALSGHLPAPAVQRATGASIEPLRRLRPDVPRALADGIHDGLELEPAHRPQTMRAFLARMGLDDRAEPGEPPVLEYQGSGTRSRDTRERERAATARWPALVPAAVAVAALGWALPVLGVTALAFALVPGIATAGDRISGLRRRALPRRFLDHLRDSLGRSATPIAFTFGAAVLSVVLDRLDPATIADDIVAGLVGAGAALAIAVPARTGPVADGVVRCCVGRALITVWIAAGLLVLGALALQPDPVPFPG